MFMKRPGRHAGEMVRFSDLATEAWFLATLVNREHHPDGTDGWAVTVTDPGTYLTPDAVGSRQHLTDQQIVPLTRRRLSPQAAAGFIGSLVIVLALIVISGVSFLNGNDGVGYQAMTSAIVTTVITGWFANWWRQT